MTKRYPFFAFLLLAGSFLLTVVSGFSQTVPELMYYKFDAAGTTTANEASALVGTNPSPIVGTGLTIGGTGQFNTALTGTGTSSTNYVNNGWATNLISIPWTISLWINNVPSGATLYYLFGDAGSSMRCFVNGAPGQGNMRLVGDGLPNVDVAGVSSGPTVIHFVRETAPNQITAYKNGVAVGTFPITGTITVGTGFRIGGYSTSTGLNGQMDEFRMYNRALSASEVSATWNQTLPLGNCTAPPTPGTAMASPAGTVCPGSSVLLSLTGNSVGSGQSYQWQSATVQAGPYTAFGTASAASSITVNPTTATWYRAAVTCSGQTIYSTPVQVTTSSIFSGGVYTINSALPTGGSNFTSFSDAVNAVRCGIAGAVTFNIVANASGYNEQISIPQISGASATSRITLNGNNATLRYASASSEARAVLKLDGADYVTIKNLNLDATTGTYGWGAHLTGQADYDSIVNCTVTTDGSSTLTNFAGIVISGSNTLATTVGNNANNAVISGNTINGGYYGIINYGNSAAPFATATTIANNTINDFYAYGLYLYGTVDNIVSSNIIQRRNRTTSGTLYSLYLGANNSNLLVQRNRLQNLFDGNTASTSSVYCIYVAADGAAGTENRIINNVVSDISHNGIIYGLYNTSGAYMLAYHNIFSFDNTAATAGTVYGFYQTGSVAGIDFRNNIISITRGGSGVKYCIYKSTAATALTSNYNDLYVSSSGSGAQNIGYQGGALPLLSNWQSTTGQDANSQNVAAGFVNPATGNYTPTAGQLNNTGTPVGVLTDILGNGRSTSAPDLGAYEFFDPLPVKLLSFAAASSRQDVVVSWATTTETDLSRFVLERSTDGQVFSFITSVVATGNSTRLKNYQYTDVAALAQYNILYYRLRSVNKDGTAEYSKVAQVKAGTRNVLAATLFPTPATTAAYVRLQALAAGRLTLQLTDGSGRILSSQQLQVPAGVSVVSLLGVEALSPGIYLVRLNQGGTETTLKLVK